MQKIKKARDLASHSALKLGLANGQISGVKDGQWVIEDRELYDMISQAQLLCLKICAHIDMRCEPEDSESRERNLRILNGDL